MKQKNFVGGIYTRLDYLANMASIIDNDYSALTIELEDIDKQIDKLQVKIHEYTPNNEDIETAKNNDRLRLTSKKSELNEINHQINEIDEELATEQKELTALLKEEASLKEQKNTLASQIEVFKGYTAESREFRSFIKDNDQDLISLEEKLSETKSAKQRHQNAISVLNDDKNKYVSQADHLNVDIIQIEERLKTDKYYYGIESIQDKLRIKVKYEKELEELEKRSEEIKNSPAYLIQQVKDNIEDKKNLDETVEMVNRVAEIALSRPYMDIVIKNGDASKLENECLELRKKKKNKEAQIRKTDYSLSKLPIEESRSKSLEQLANACEQKKELCQSIKDINQTAITVLSNQVKELESEFNKRDEDVKTVLETMSNNASSSKAIAKKASNQSKMKKELINHQEIIAKYKNDIAELIMANQAEDEKIKSLDALYKMYTNEMTSISKLQLKRTNYYDVVKQVQDQLEVEKLQDDIDAIENRIKFKNFNVSTLRTEATQAIRKLIGKAEVKKAEEPKEVKVVEEKTTKLDDMLTKEPVSQKDVEASIADFEKTLKMYVDAVKENEKSAPLAKQEEIKEDNDLEKKIENKNDDQIIRVISVVPLVKPVNEEVQNNNIEKRLKVINIEPMIKKTTPSNEQANMDIDEIISSIYNPFALESIGSQSIGSR